MIIAVMASHWKVKAQITAAAGQSRQHQIIQALLTNRNLTTPKLRHLFLSPPPPQTIKPQSIGLSLPALKTAVKRIKKAIKDQELIYIYGDYDTDGITATAVLWEALNLAKAKVLPFIPARGEPVRGLSPQGINLIIKAAGQKPSLIITVDNGISAFKGCLYAAKLGIDVIISDHHQSKTKNHQPVYPKALAIVHTLELAGVGVSWFLAQAVLKTTSTLDLVALGTIADMVPLLNANRSLTKFGLEKLKRTPRPGLIALAKTAGLDLDSLEAFQVSYVLAPRLNAMGRLEHALDALRLLCTTDQHRAHRLAADLSKTNQLRQDITIEMFIKAKNMFLTQPKDQPLIFLADASFHEGVVGLVAGRLVEEFNRPVFMVALTKNYAKASVRSIKGFNAIKAIRSLQNLLLEHGGHELAAGFTSETKNLPAIQAKLEILAAKALAKKTLTPALAIDCQLNLSDITWELFNQLEKLKPFGFANSQPVFCTRRVKLLSFRSVGQDQKHLKLNLQGETLKLAAIAFNHGHLANQLTPSQFIDIAYTIEQNTWNGKKDLQLKIKDIIK